MQLNSENYHGPEANRRYMSYSQYCEFLSCEARATAKLAGWEEEPSPARLVGQYVHAGVEGKLESFQQKHSEIFKRGGGLKSDFAQAEEMLAAIRKDPLMTRALEGDHEVICVTEWEGVLWKAKFDVRNEEKGFITDLKTARNLLHKEWNGRERRYEHFIEHYGYIGQMALYRELDRIEKGRNRPLDVFMAIITKESPPNKIVLTFEPVDRLQYELNEIRRNLPHVMAVKNGEVEPARCENCDYCRETSLWTKQVWDYDEWFGEIWGKL
jgi:hypothetical protein